jgi:ribosomal protein S14
MKLLREKNIRKEYVHNHLDLIVNQMTRGITLTENFKKHRKSYRNICQETGRARGVIKLYRVSRLIFRSLADNGKIEGVRRAS